MAIAKKCDRCGKYYDKNTEHKQNIMCFTVSGLNTDFKDLCDECLDKLHIFLNGAELIMEDGKK